MRLALPLVALLTLSAFPTAVPAHGTLATFVAPTCASNSEIVVEGVDVGPADPAQPWRFTLSGNAVNGGSCIGFFAVCDAVGSPEAGWTGSDCVPTCSTTCLASFTLSPTWNSRPPFGVGNTQPLDQAAATLTLAFTSGFPAVDYDGILVVVA